MELKLIAIGLATFFVGFNGYRAGMKAVRQEESGFQFFMMVFWGGLIMINALSLYGD